MLVDFFIGRANEELAMEVSGCSEDALKLLTSYDWPGNVRQLENAIRRAVLLSADKVLTAEDFPDYVDVAPTGPGQVNLYREMGYEVIIID